MAPLPNGVRGLRLHPAAGGRLGFVLPQVIRQLPGSPAHSLLVVAVREVRAQGAASVVRAIGVDTRAAAAEDAGPVRGQPGEVTPEDLISVSRIDELHEGPGKGQADFGHGLQPTLGALGADR